jgi:hypothetical protein
MENPGLLPAAQIRCARPELIAVSVDVDKHIVAGADALAAKRRCGFENRAGIAQFGYFRLE